MEEGGRAGGEGGWWLSSRSGYSRDEGGSCLFKQAPLRCRVEGGREEREGLRAGVEGEEGSGDVEVGWWWVGAWEERREGGMGRGVYAGVACL